MGEGMSELTHKDLLWFRLANSNPPHGFYDFKDRFLKRFGTPDGFDLQHVNKMCWSCDGSGEYLKGVACNKCGGDGVYRTNEHWLARFQLGGAIYHKPMDHADVWHMHDYKWPETKNFIDGKIQHESVDSKVARRAFFRLLIRHEPCVFYRRVCDAIKDRAYWFRVKLVWRLVRIRNRMDLFKAVPEDEIPF